MKRLIPPKQTLKKQMEAVKGILIAAVILAAIAAISLGDYYMKKYISQQWTREVLEEQLNK